MDEIKIPKLRVAVLIGTKGEIKKLIERKTKTKLKISKEGDVVIEGEGLDCYTAKLIIKAIGRGFNPDIALCLLNDKNSLELISIKDFSGKSEKKLTRLKSRLIGTKGKARKTIERLTDTNIVIYGKSVGIIGKIEGVYIARRAIENLLKGAPHSHVYKFVEDELKKRKI